MPPALYLWETSPVASGALGEGRPGELAGRMEKTQEGGEEGAGRSRRELSGPLGRRPWGSGPLQAQGVCGSSQEWPSPGGTLPSFLQGLVGAQRSWGPVQATDWACPSLCAGTLFKAGPGQRGTQGFGEPSSLKLPRTLRPSPRSSATAGCGGWAPARPLCHLPLVPASCPARPARAHPVQAAALLRPGRQGLCGPLGQRVRRQLPPGPGPGCLPGSQALPQSWQAESSQPRAGRRPSRAPGRELLIKSLSKPQTHRHSPAFGKGPRGEGERWIPGPGAAGPGAPPRPCQAWGSGRPPSGASSRWPCTVWPVFSATWLCGDGARDAPGPTVSRTLASARGHTSACVGARAGAGAGRGAKPASCPLPAARCPPLKLSLGICEAPAATRPRQPRAGLAEPPLEHAAGDRPAGPAAHTTRGTHVRPSRPGGDSGSAWVVAEAQTQHLETSSSWTRKRALLGFLSGVTTCF